MSEGSTDDQVGYRRVELHVLVRVHMVEPQTGRAERGELRPDFDRDKLPISAPPEVSIELPTRLRASFNKILTKIKEGVLTAARGAALVLPRSSAPEELTRPPR